MNKEDLKKMAEEQGDSRNAQPPFTVTGLVKDSGDIHGPWTELDDKTASTFDEAMDVLIGILKVDPGGSHNLWIRDFNGKRVLSYS